MLFCCSRIKCHSSLGRVCRQYVNPQQAASQGACVSVGEVVAEKPLGWDIQYMSEPLTCFSDIVLQPSQSELHSLLPRTRRAMLLSAAPPPPSFFQLLLQDRAHSLSCSVPHAVGPVFIRSRLFAAPVCLPLLPRLFAHPTAWPFPCFCNAGGISFKHS